MNVRSGVHERSPIGVVVLVALGGVETRGQLVQSQGSTSRYGLVCNAA